MRLIASSLHLIHEALPNTKRFTLRLVHQVYNVENLPDLNLRFLVGDEWEIAQQFNALDRKWYTQHVLAREFFQAPDAYALIQTGRKKLVTALWVPRQGPQRLMFFTRVAQLD